MHDAEWALPPVARPLDYVPVGVRPMFQDLFTEMLHWLDQATPPPLGPPRPTGSTRAACL